MPYVCQVEPTVLRIKVNATAPTSTLSSYSAEKTRRKWGTNSSDSAGGSVNVATHDFHFFRVQIL
jgi:hypothetical protein